MTGGLPLFSKNGTKMMLWIFAARGNKQRTQLGDVCDELAGAIRDWFSWKIFCLDSHSFFPLRL
jgi:hypothetical protein